MTQKFARTDTVLRTSSRAGTIAGALGTLSETDAPRTTWRARIAAFLAVLGPGLIVMTGDNDAGAFGTYAAAGQNYGTTLLWTLLLLVPVLYVNQEMVLRLGAVTGVGHARLILARFGRFWGAFSVIDLFVLNALTLVTEFIGIDLALQYLGVPRIAGVAGAALLLVAGVMQGEFRRFERFALALCCGTLVIVPIAVAAHGHLGGALHDALIPRLPGGGLSSIMLFVIAIVGTTIAPWQLFFQQSYVIDKRITARLLSYERWDLAVGIVVVILGAAAIMIFTAAAFAGRPEAGHFTDAGAVARGLASYVHPWAGTLFALGLLDASIIGAAAVSLSTAYAFADVTGMRHSLHRGAGDAPWFYAIYAVLIACAAALVLTPGVPLGLLTNAVQVLAGVLLPSATVFLLLLCNDSEVLGPWTNSRFTNIVTGIVIAVLVVLSIILTAAVVMPDLRAAIIVRVLASGAIAIVIGTIVAVLRRPPVRTASGDRTTWRMPMLETLAPRRLTMTSRVWLIVLRAYLLVAAAMVVVRAVQLAMGAR